MNYMNINLNYFPAFVTYFAFDYVYISLYFHQCYYLLNKSAVEVCIEKH